MRIARFAVGLLLASVTPVNGQGLVLRESDGSHARLTLERIATLKGDRVLGAPISLVRRPAGGFYVSFYPTGNEILEFDDAGDFVQVLAPTGEGPGEVTAARHLQIVSDGSLQAYDVGRVLTFSRTGQFVAAKPVRFPAPDDVVQFGPDHLVINAQYFRGGQAQPLHLVRNGEIVASFGADPRVPIQPTTPHLHRRSIVAAADGRFWTAPLTKYEIQEWTGGAEHVRTLTREVDWFREWHESRPVDPASSLEPRLTDLGRTPEGYLLVVLALPAPGWEKFLGEPRQGPGGRVSYPDADFSRLFTARLEVIDPDSRRVVAAHDTDAGISLIVDDEHVAAYREDALGTPFVDVYRLRVARQ